MTSPGFAVTVGTVRHNGRTHTTVAVGGEIDVTNAAEFVRTVDGIEAARPLVVDLGGLGYLDSAGFAALDDLLARRAVVVVLAPDSPIHAAAMLMGLPCHDTVQAATAAA